MSSKGREQIRRRQNTFQAPQQSKTDTFSPDPVAPDVSIPSLAEANAGHDFSKIRIHNDETSTQSTVDDGISSPSQPLDAATLGYMEPRFGHDFSKVRVHADGRAAAAARDVNATAYTVGQDIVFDSGAYIPETETGKHLLAHELAHVVQQSRGASSTTPPLPVGPLEQAADNAASIVAQGGTTSVMGASAPGIACQPRSLQESLDPTTMSDADLTREIALIQQWLSENPASSPERDQLTGTITTMQAEAARRNGGQDQTSANQGQSQTATDQLLAGTAAPMLAAGVLGPSIGPVNTPLGPVSPPTGPVNTPLGPVSPPTGPIDTPLGPVSPPTAPVEAPLGPAPVLEEGALEGAVETEEVLETAAVLAEGESLLGPVGWVLVGLTAVAVVSYLGYHYLTSNDGRPSRPLTPEEERQLSANQNNNPMQLPGQQGQNSTPAVDPTTGEPLYTPADGDYTPAVDPVTGVPLQAPPNQSIEPVQASGSRRGDEDDDDNGRQAERRRDEARRQGRADKSIQQIDPQNIDILDNGYVEFSNGSRPAKAYSSEDEALEAFRETYPDARIGNTREATGNNFHIAGQHIGVETPDGIYLGTIFEGTVQDITTNEIKTVYTITFK